MKKNDRAFNKTPLAVALTLTFGSLAMMATPVAAQGTVKSSQTFDQDTTITVDGTYSTNQYAGIVAVTSGTPSNVEVTMGAGKTLTISGDATNNGWGQLRGVVVWDGSTAKVNGDTVLNLSSKDQQVRGINADAGTVTLNGGLSGTITTQGGAIAALDSQNNSNFTVNGATKLELTSETGYVLGVQGGYQTNSGGTITLKDLDITGTTGGEVNGVLLKNTEANVNGKTNLKVTGKTAAGLILDEGATATLNGQTDVTVNAGTSGQAEAWGAWVKNGSTLTFDGVTTLTVNNGVSHPVEVDPTVLRLETGSVVNFEDNATLALKNESGGYGVHVVNGANAAKNAVNFKGQVTSLNVEANTALAVNVSGPNSETNFTGETVNITAKSLVEKDPTTGKDIPKKNTKAVGFNSQYGGVINVNSTGKTTVNATADTAYGIMNQTYGGASDKSFGSVNVNNDIEITATGRTQAIGIGSSVSGSEAVSNVSATDGVFVKGTATVTVEALDNAGEAFGVYVDNSKNGEKQPKSKVELNNVTVTAKGLTGANAYGVYLEDKGDLTINGNATVKAQGENSYGLTLVGSDLTVNGSSNFEGEKLGTSMDATSVVNVTQNAKLATNSMTSTGTTNLDQGTLSVHNAEGKSSTLGNVSSTGGTVDLGSGDYTVSKLETTNGSTTTLQLNDLKAKVNLQQTVGDPGALTLKGTKAANNTDFANAEVAVQALVDAVAKNSAASLEGVKVHLAEGEFQDDISFTVGPNGEQLNKVVKKNSTLTAYNGLATLTTFQWRHDMNDLTKRMGELRLSPDGVGAWARVYGSKQTYGTQGLTAKNHSLQVGVDTTVTPEWTVGTAFTYTDGKSTYDLGSADNKAYGFAAYGTWMAENGQFVDLIAKYSRLSNDFTVNQDAMAGSFDNNAFSVSAEYGWHWNLNDVGFLEPQAELTYGKVLGETFTASNGVKVVQEDFESLIARLGVRGGFYFPNQKGVVYARASVLHDFKGEMESTASKNVARNTVKDDIGGTWVEWGVGANFKLSDTAYTYVDVERTNGGEVVEDWRYNAGVRLVF